MGADVPANQPTRLRSDLPLLPLQKNADVLWAFQNAARGFVKHAEGTVEIWAANRDWFLEEWGRDTFIALPGILLARGRYDEARQNFLRFAGFEKAGLIPNRIRKGEVLFNTVDASLWFVRAADRYLSVTGDWDFIRKLLPTMRSIVLSYAEGTGYDRFGTFQKIAMDSADGLIRSPVQATWMDADPSGNGSMIVTPRHGKAVEINALWHAALLTIARFEENVGEAPRAVELRSLASTVQQSFLRRFWNDAGGCLCDIVDGDHHSDAVRPNQIFAISLGAGLLSPVQRSEVFAVVAKDLLTPGGLRTLSPRDPKYHGHYDTFQPMFEKDQAYHQGTVWPWLIGAYCDALAIIRRDQGISEESIRTEIEGVINPLVRFCLESPYRSLPEVFSGDPPYEPGGTRSQAWSVAEVLRVLVEYGFISFGEDGDQTEEV